MALLISSSGDGSLVLVVISMLSKFVFLGCEPQPFNKNRINAVQSSVISDFIVGSMYINGFK